jgi:hypothetical protein
MQGLSLLLLGWFLVSVPAQSRHVGQQVQRQASKVELERHEDACMGLDEAECCAQLLQIAGFRATGDQLPPATKTPLRLSCEAPQKTFPETSCRLLAMSRGFGAKETAELCAPGNLAKRCRDDASCKQCVDDLGRLAWKSPHRACYALTYAPRARSEGAKVVTLTRGRDGAPAANSGNSITVKRTVVR